MFLSLLETNGICISILLNSWFYISIEKVNTSLNKCNYFKRIVAIEVYVSIAKI